MKKRAKKAFFFGKKRKPNEDEVEDDWKRCAIDFECAIANTH